MPGVDATAISFFPSISFLDTKHPRQDEFATPFYGASRMS